MKYVLALTLVLGVNSLAFAQEAFDAQGKRYCPDGQVVKTSFFSDRVPVKNTLDRMDFLLGNLTDYSPLEVYADMDVIKIERVKAKKSLFNDTGYGWKVSYCSEAN